MGVSPGMAVHYFVISRIIERIGDHAERIVENANVILKRDIDPAIISMISKASKLSIGIFDRSIISFFDNDMKKAQQTIESVKELEAICEEINNLVLQQETSDAVALGYITESIRRAGEYAADISENVINYLVEEKQFQKKEKTTK
jgi:phosphate uptake regulator